MMTLLQEGDVGKRATKLHRQFGHPTAKKLKKLVQDAEIHDSTLEREIDKVTRECDVCARYRRPCSRPVVSVPLASQFNEAVAMDLKSWGRKYFLVLVDLYTRYCTAVLISDKLATTIIKGIFRCWIVMFGAPRKFLSDNGCEFNNKEMRSLGEKFNIKIMTTAAESPWSNGVCERLNAVLGGMVNKILCDYPGTDLEIALAWAVSARNALSTFSGFSPNQLLFGQNPSLPGVFYDDLPALEKEDVPADIVRHNLNALHASRRAFTQAESSERLARAFRHNVRDSDPGDVHYGDEVYYKRLGCDEWRGPGIVIGRDGKQYLVRHGGVYVRVHSCRLTSAPNRDVENAGVTSFDKTNNVASTVRTVPLLERDKDCDVDDTDSDDERDEDLGSSGRSDVGMSETSADNDVAGTQSHGPGEAGGQKVKVKVGQRIKGIEKASGEWLSGTVVSRAGKATGKWKNCYNIQRDADGSVGWMDLDKDFTDWEIVDDNVEMLVFFNTDEVMIAKRKEMENWERHDVYEEVENVGQRAVSVRWVVTQKVKDGNPFVKARLVARGFEEHDLDVQKDSPACSREGIRISLAIASAKGWLCHTMDIQAAYLQGNRMEREVYLHPPPEFSNGSLWRLKKTVYGLCDAARQWYNRVKELLIHLGASICSLDPALFAWKHKYITEGIICIYVDDFLWAGTDRFERQIINELKDRLQVGSTDSGQFKYIGLNLTTTGDGNITVDQHQYCATLCPMKLSKTRTMMKTSDLSEEEKAEYRALVGQLNWIATQTRPDISFDIGELSTSTSKARVLDAIRLNKVIERVKTDNVRLVIPNLKPLSMCHIECYADASFANLPDQGSQGGYIIFLCDGGDRKCPLYWQSRKIRRVVKSTLAAETLALVDAAGAAVYLVRILNEMAGCGDLPIRCFVDNRNLVEALNSYKMVDDRRLRIDISALKEMLEREELHEVKWIDTSKQLADCLTKKGASTVRLRATVSWI